MTEVQARLLCLLEEIDEICQKNEITYYIDGGTALGAVRHRGFLPWDDDADITMTRDNWNRFRTVIMREPRQDRVLVDIQSNDEYTMLYARYCDTSSTCILRTSMLNQFKSGLFIDIFIMDPIPDTKEARQEYFDILSGYAEYLNPYYYDEVVGDNKWYDTFRKMGEKKGRAAVTEFVESKLFCYPDVDGMTYAFRFDLDHFIYGRDVMGMPQRVPFEDTVLPVAAKAGDYLREHYGDMWTQIPQDIEVQKHNVVINLNVPYEQFMESYINRIDKAEAIRTYEKLHELRVEYKRCTTEIDMSYYTTVAQCFAQMLKIKGAAAKKELQEKLANNDYNGIREWMGNYYDIQLARWFMKYGVYVPLEDWELYYALYVLMIEGKYYQADKILSLRKDQPGELSAELREIDTLIEDIRNVARCFENSNPEEALEISSRNLEKHPNIPDFIVGRLRALAARPMNQSAVKNLIQEIDELEEPNSLLDRVRSIRYMLVTCYESGVKAILARKALEDMMETTSDGMLRLEISDFFKCIEDRAQE